MIGTPLHLNSHSNSKGLLSNCIKRQDLKMFGTYEEVESSRLFQRQIKVVK